MFSPQMYGIIVFSRTLGLGCIECVGWFFPSLIHANYKLSVGTLGTRNYHLCQGGYESVQDCAKTTKLISRKFGGRMQHRPRTDLLNFGANPSHKKQIMTQRGFLIACLYTQLAWDWWKSFSCPADAMARRIIFALNYKHFVLPVS